MPRQNRPGPMGAGVMSGRGSGRRGSGQNGPMGPGGRGMRRNGCRQKLGGGFGGGMWLEEDSPEIQKQLLTERKEFLEERINCINQQLEEL